MPFTEAQREMLEQPFSGSDAQLRLVHEKVSKLRVELAQLRKGSVPIGISLAAAGVLRILGLSTVFFVIPLDLLLVGLAGWMLRDLKAPNEAYREAFADALVMYDWIFPDKGAMPPTDKSPVQGLIDVMGSLINSERLSRLNNIAAGDTASHMNMADVTGKVVSGTINFIGGFFGIAPSRSQYDHKVMPPAQVSEMARNYTTGKTTSWWDYCIFGEGGTQLQGITGHLFDRGRAMIGLATAFIPKGHTVTPTTSGDDGPTPPSFG